jgi:hypothetical protein
MTEATAAAPSAASDDGLRRVAIDPVSRVEGHGKVTLLLDEHHRVSRRGCTSSSSAASRASSSAGPTGRCR